LLGKFNKIIPLFAIVIGAADGNRSFHYCVTPCLFIVSLAYRIARSDESGGLSVVRASLVYGTDDLLSASPRHSQSSVITSSLHCYRLVDSTH
jgi:hypothetical protein